MATSWGMIQAAITVRLGHSAEGQMTPAGKNGTTAKCSVVYTALKT